MSKKSDIGKVFIVVNSETSVSNSSQPFTIYPGWKPWFGDSFRISLHRASSADQSQSRKMGTFGIDPGALTSLHVTILWIVVILWILELFLESQLVGHTIIAISSGLDFRYWCEKRHIDETRNRSQKMALWMCITATPGRWLCWCSGWTLDEFVFGMDGCNH
jgi:hypothetical protein